MVSRSGPRALAFAVVLAGLLLALVPAPSALAAPGPHYPAIVGSFTGRTLVATGSNTTYYINGTGGPAIAPNGTEVGSIAWKATVSGGDLSGVSLSPNSSTLSGPGPAKTYLKVNDVAQTLVLQLTLNSTDQGVSATKTFNLTVRVVVPYIVHAELVVPGKTGVLGFSLTVALDGSTVATVHVPAIAAGGTYNFTYAYPTTGLSVGRHTFTISLPPTGLVRFEGGALEYSQSFYVVGPPPDYALYLLVGAIVFFGVLFIFLTRVAARRRPATRR